MCTLLGSIQRAGVRFARRPCVVVSPDELNRHLHTVMIAPMTTGGQAYPWRVTCRFQGRAGFVALDQVRTVDTARLRRDRKSTRLNSSHGYISYAVFCLKKKKNTTT